MEDLARIRSLLGNTVRSGDAGVVPTGVVVDSRAVRAGSLFIALPGEHTDGQHFVAQSLEAGAVAAVVRMLPAQPELAARCILVEDPARALETLAAHARERFSGTVVAITGSNGKTTTKELLRRILSLSRVTGASPGNLNSTIGAPLAFLNHSSGCACWVQETGASAPGEIARICGWLQPDAGAVTNIAEAHLERFGSLEGVLSAKSELLEALAARAARIVLNTGDPLLGSLAGRWPRTLAYSLEQGLALDGAPLRWRGLSERGCGLFQFDGETWALPVPGIAFAECACCAAALAHVCGATAAEIREGLSAWEDPGGSGGRMRVIQSDTLLLLDDSYNANPASVRAALRTLRAIPVTGRRWAALGFMAELGTGERELHHETGRRAAEAGLDALLAVGPQPALDALLDGYLSNGGTMGVRCQGIPGALEALAGLKDGDALLVKGSRSAGLDTLVRELA
ncbi:MAG: UDP-N-acetylmuramoyl-tripeptide--D-alanyl-D-alanine ligase [Candidatus Delongbacteria bacterium]|nr:UDP-N-acetylmuramoyl-tripeptide--D-alanyl-D-alanine ligase [Candidatus Delongbacteria bacterium]